MKKEQNFNCLFAGNIDQIKEQIDLVVSICLKNGVDPTVLNAKRILMGGVR